MEKITKEERDQLTHRAWAMKSVHDLLQNELNCYMINLANKYGVKGKFEITKEGEFKILKEEPEETKTETEEKTEEEKVKEFEQLKKEGISDAEARGTIWPERSLEESAPAEETTADQASE